MGSSIEKVLIKNRRMDGISDDIHSIGRVVLEKYKSESESPKSSQDYISENFKIVKGLNSIVDEIQELDKKRLKGETFLSIDERLNDYLNLREKVISLSKDLLDLNELPELYECRLRNKNIDRILE